MKNNLLTAVVSALFMCSVSTTIAQTAGTLTFSFTPTSHNGYSGQKKLLAIWIETASGTFIKTNHLPLQV